jgi:hypothetical protein
MSKPDSLKIDEMKKPRRPGAFFFSVEDPLELNHRVCLCAGKIIVGLVPVEIHYSILYGDGLYQGLIYIHSLFYSLWHH